jgi:hypothetical protein
MRSGIVAFITGLVSAHSFASANFTISPTPGTVLPTSVQKGATVSAFYTITNNTSTWRRNYTVQGLPATVIQNTANGHCPNPVTLAGKTSCILQLDITGTAQTGFVLCRGSSCNTASAPLNVTLSNIIIPFIASGVYENQSSKFVPLLASSMDMGETWAYTISDSTPALPSDFNNSSALVSTSCRGSLCIAGGQYSSSSAIYPLLAVSTDNAATWVYRISSSYPTLSDSSSSALFNSVSCGSNTCIAAGQYLSNNTITYPLVATDVGNGLTWTYTMTSTNIPVRPSDYSTNGIFNSTSCSGNLCIAVGNYVSTNTKQYPLIATSTDGGVTWTYTLASNTLTYPTDYVNQGNFDIASCSGSICIAAGGYYNGSFNYPLLATSNDGGATWTFTVTSTIPNGIPIDGNFNSASCSGSTCIAVGNYASGALLANSTDGGLTWTYIDVVPPGPPNTGFFRGASCNGSTCVAAGGYANGSVGYPYVITSTNGGLTWANTATASTLGLPPNGAGSENFFSSVNCSNYGSCIASGKYFSSSQSFPLLATSSNNGLTWKYTITSTSPTLPADYDSSGILVSTNVDTSPLLPNSLRFIFGQR